MRRPTSADSWTEASTRDVLGLSVLSLDPEVDAALIEGRNTLHKWITVHEVSYMTFDTHVHSDFQACTQAVLWEVHSKSDDTYKVDYGANWGKVGPTRRQFLIDTVYLLHLYFCRFRKSHTISGLPGGLIVPG